MAPEISVISSLYQSEDFLTFFLQNLRGQTIFNHAEFLIFSVCPSEYERSVLENFGQLYPNVRVFFEQKRIGIYEAWNAAIRLAQAELITNANDDDVRSPESLEIQVGYMRENPRVDIAYSDVYVSLEPLVSWEISQAIGFKTSLPKADAITFARYGVNFPHCAPVWRKSIHAELGMFREDLISAADADKWLLAALRGREFGKIREPYVSYFLNPSGLSSRSKSPGPGEFARVYNEFRRLLAQDFEIQSQLPAAES